LSSLIRKRRFNRRKIYTHQDNYAQALDYHKKELRLQEDLGNKIEVAIVLLNIGNIYEYESDYAQALKYRKMALGGFVYGQSACGSEFMES